MENWVTTDKTHSSQVTNISTGTIRILLSLESSFSIPPWRGACTITRWLPTMLSTSDVRISITKAHAQAKIVLKKVHDTLPQCDCFHSEM